MPPRYEIRDSHNPTWKGQRFTSEDRARRELARCHGEPGRFQLIDRWAQAILDTAPKG